MSTVAQDRVALPARSGADLAMRRLLRIPEAPARGASKDSRSDRAADRAPEQGSDKAALCCALPSEQDVHRLFSVSIVISAVRCLLGYVLLPILTPALHAAGALGPALGIPLGIVALVFDVRGMRRFFLADHRYRWPISVLYLAVMLLVVVLLVHDIAHFA